MIWCIICLISQISIWWIVCWIVWWIVCKVIWDHLLNSLRLFEESFEIICWGKCEKDNRCTQHLRFLLDYWRLFVWLFATIVGLFEIICWIIYRLCDIICGLLEIICQIQAWINCELFVKNERSFVRLLRIIWANLEIWRNIWDYLRLFDFFKSNQRVLLHLYFEQT